MGKCGLFMYEYDLMRWSGKVGGKVDEDGGKVGGKVGGAEVGKMWESGDWGRGDGDFLGNFQKISRWISTGWEGGNSEVGEEISMFSR